MQSFDYIQFHNTKRIEFIEFNSEFDSELLNELYNLYYDNGSSENILSDTLDYIKDVFDETFYSSVLDWLIRTINNIKQDEFITRTFLNDYVYKIIYSFKDNHKELLDIVFHKMIELSQQEWFKTTQGLNYILVVINRKYDGGHLCTKLMLNILNEGYNKNNLDDFNTIMHI